MIIDSHGHYTTAPASHTAWRAAQLAAAAEARPSPRYPVIGDDEIIESVRDNQLRLSTERGTDLTLFSPRASAMAHHEGDGRTSQEWAVACNDLVHRVVGLFPGSFAGVCQLPQSPGSGIEKSLPELERCIIELGFVGCNLNPDPSGGRWTADPLTDRSWYPLYERLVELDVPAMIHVSSSCNVNFHATGAHYLNADTTAFMQLLQGDLFADFPTLRLVIPHGGGAVPYHWGRYRGLADMLGRPPLAEHLMRNVFFDTCVYHQPGIDLLFEVIDHDNLLFGSEMIGAVRGIDPTTGHHFDDTRRYVDALDLPRRRASRSTRATRAGSTPGSPSTPPRRSAHDHGVPGGRRVASPAGRALPAHLQPPGRFGRRALPRLRAGIDRFPYAPERKYTPADAPKDELFALHRRLGLDRCVIVQATCHGYDNRALVDALQSSDGVARGVASVRPDVSAAELDDLHQAGVRGVRLNFVRRLADPEPDATYRALADRIAERGWHIVLYFEAPDLADRWDLFTSLPVPVVVDHMGRPDVSLPVDGPEFGRLRRLLSEHRDVWAKVSCPERLSLLGPPAYDDVVPFARTLVAEFPDRVLWGTDWPHPNMTTHMPDDGNTPRLRCHRIAHGPRAFKQKRLLVD